MIVLIAAILVFALLGQSAFLKLPSPDLDTQQIFDREFYHYILTDLLTQSNGLTPVQQAKRLGRFPDGAIVKKTTEYICAMTREEFDKINFEVIRELAKAHLDPLVYFENCTHVEHLLPVTREVAARVLSKDSFKTFEMVRVIYTSMAQPCVDFNFHMLFGTDELPNDSTTDFLTDILGKLLLNQKVRKQFFEYLLKDINDPISAKSYQDYVSGQAFMSAYALRPLSIVHLKVLPRLLTIEYLMEIRMWYPQFDVLFRKIKLLEFYNPCESLTKGYDEKSIALAKHLLSEIEKHECIDELMESIKFSNHLFYAAITSNHENSYSLVQDKFDIQDDIIPLLFLKKYNNVPYWRNVILAKLAVIERKEFTEKVFDFYNLHYQEINENIFVKYLEKCPLPIRFFHVCKHRWTDLAFLKKAVERVSTIPDGSALAVDALLGSLPKKSDSKCPSFGEYSTPDAEYLLELSKLDLFKCPKALAVVKVFLISIMQSNNAPNVSRIRRAYGIGLIALIDPSSIKFTSKQQLANVILFKIAPYVLSKEAFNELYKIKLNRKQSRELKVDEAEQREIIALVQWSAYYNQFTLSPTNDKSKLLPVDSSLFTILEHVQRLDTAAMLLRLILSSQPQYFGALLSTGLPKLPDFTKLPRFAFKLALDCRRQLEDEPNLSDQEASSLLLAKEILSKQALFNFQHAANLQELELLVAVNLDLEMYVNKFSTYSDADLRSVMKFFFKCARDSAHFEQQVLSCLSGKKARRVASIMSTL